MNHRPDISKRKVDMPAFLQYWILHRLSLLMAIVLVWILSVPIAAVPREFVLVDLFTSTSCTGCPGAAMGVHDLISNGHAVAVLASHPNDLYTNPSALGRYLFYGPVSTPTAFFDGLEPTSTPSSGVSLYPVYLPKVDARLAVPSHFTISATGVADSLNYDTTVSIVKAEVDTNSTVVLYAAITESSIPYVWLNQSTLSYVNRLMIPDHNGTSVPLQTLAPGEQIAIDLSFRIKHDWFVDNCEIIIWIQNPLSKEVLQVQKYSLTELVLPPNQAPRIDLPESLGFDVNSFLRLDFAAFVSDPDADPLTLSCSGNENMLVNIAGLDVILSAPQDWHGSEMLIFTVSDGLESAADIVLVTVHNLLAPRVLIALEADQIILSWDPVPLAGSYQVWAADTPDGEYALRAVVTGTSWSEGLALNSQKRFYRVRAVSGP